jgi:GNAT superfamily N-acetyltransferase
LLKCRDMRPGEEPEVLALVMRGFDGFVRPDLSAEGTSEFTRAARSFVVEHPVGHAVTVAERDGELHGMIDLRDGSHVSLFFVEAAHQRQGVGAALLDAATAKHPETAVVTVNSGPSAVSAYHALAFTATAPEAEVNGIRYVAMRKERPARG